MFVLTCFPPGHQSNSPSGIMNCFYLLMRPTRAAAPCLCKPQRTTSAFVSSDTPCHVCPSVALPNGHYHSCQSDRHELNMSPWQRVINCVVCRVGCVSLHHCPPPPTPLPHSIPPTPPRLLADARPLCRVFQVLFKADNSDT